MCSCAVFVVFSRTIWYWCGKRIGPHHKSIFENYVIDIKWLVHKVDVQGNFDLDFASRLRVAVVRKILTKLDFGMEIVNSGVDSKALAVF